MTQQLSLFASTSRASFEHSFRLVFLKMAEGEASGAEYVKLISYVYQDVDKTDGGESGLGCFTLRSSQLVCRLQSGLSPVSSPLDGIIDVYASSVGV